MVITNHCCNNNYGYKKNNKISHYSIYSYHKKQNQEKEKKTNKQ